MLQTIDDVLALVRSRLEQGDLAGAVALIESLRSPDQADLFAELEEAEQTALLPKLDPGDSADILEELEDEAAARMVDRLTTIDLASTSTSWRRGKQAIVARPVSRRTHGSWVILRGRLRQG